MSSSISYQYTDLLDRIFNDPRLNFQKFIYKNSVLISATAYSIGSVTKEFLTAILDTLLFPLFAWVGKALLSTTGKNAIFSAIGSPALIDLFTRLGNVFWLFFVWIITIYMTYVVLEHLLNRTILGLATRIPDKDKKDFVKARIQTEGYKFDEEKYKAYMHEIDNNAQEIEDELDSAQIAKKKE